MLHWNKIVRHTHQDRQTHRQTDRERYKQVLDECWRAGQAAVSLTSS